MGMAHRDGVARPRQVMSHLIIMGTTVKCLLLYALNTVTLHCPDAAGYASVHDRRRVTPTRPRAWSYSHIDRRSSGTAREWRHAERR